MDVLNTILAWIIGICSIFLLIFGILYFWDKHSKLKFFCNILKWHPDPKYQDSNGWDHYGTCPRCGKKIYQNDDGSWETRKEEIEEDND